ncbi:MAG: hypothetical protein ACXADO_11435 [Candidatus Thorarchaeota archaeon]|jgi:hypothetical protein
MVRLGKMFMTKRGRKLFYRDSGKATFRTKPEAKARAERERKNGFNARIAKRKDRYGRTMHDVYVRKS